MIATILNSAFVQAQVEDENLLDYDSIVRDLSSSTSQLETPLVSSDPFAQLLFHGGLGYATSYIIVDPENGPVINGVLKGIEFSLGIDLLSRNWMAEGAVRAF